MVGRFIQLPAWAEIASSYRLENVEAPDGYQPRYNISPAQPCLIIRKERDGRRAAMLDWGLIPFFAARKPVNRLTVAPADSVMESPSFRDAFSSRRCLVPCSGFFAWRAVQWAPKQPYLVSMADGLPFAMAAIWERWVDPRFGTSLQTFAIVMTDANEVMTPIGKQMPAILDSQSWATWLDHSATNEALRLLQPYPSKRMSAFRVSSKVNDRKNEGPDLILPVG